MSTDSNNLCTVDAKASTLLADCAHSQHISSTYSDTIVVRDDQLSRVPRPGPEAHDFETYVKIRAGQLTVPDGTDLVFVLPAAGGLRTDCCVRPVSECVWWYRVVDGRPKEMLSVVV